MSDAMSATEGVVFNALDSGITGAPVFQDVPEDAPMPLVVLGDMKAEAAWGKNDPDRRITVTVVAMVGAEERAPLLDLQRQIEALLDGAQFAADGWLIALDFTDADAVLGDDGVSYLGTSNFSVLALKQ